MSPPASLQFLITGAATLIATANDTSSGECLRPCLYLRARLVLETLLGRWILMGTFVDVGRVAPKAACLL